MNDKTLKEMLMEALAGEPLAGRKLSFVEQCGAFAALYNGARNQIVARAFHISIQTTSNLAGCLEVDPEPYRIVIGREPTRHDPEGAADMKVLMDHNRNRTAGRRKHYPHVAAEFDALGKDEFTNRYYTRHVHDRIMEAKAELRLAKNNRKIFPIPT